MTTNYNNNNVVEVTFWNRISIPLRRFLNYLSNIFGSSCRDTSDGRKLSSLTSWIRNVFRRTDPRAYYIDHRTIPLNPLPLPHNNIIREYSMTHKKRGLAVIFNQENFELHFNLASRTGTEVDLDSLIKTFERLNFEVIPHTDLDLKGITKNLENVAAMDHSQCDCLVIVILSHGVENRIYSIDGAYSIDHITSFFTDEKCPSLIGKPKLVLIQACRGTSIDRGHQVQQRLSFDLRRYDMGHYEEIDVTTYREIHPIALEKDQELVYFPPQHPDFLIVRSTMPKYASFRNPKNGSWFIQDLCFALDQFGTKTDMLTLLTYVNQRVAIRSSDPGLGKQILCISSMLTKQLIFKSKFSTVQNSST